MAAAGRNVVAVVAGAMLWAVLWIGGTQVVASVYPALFVAGEPVTNTGVLLGLIAYGVVLSVLAGYATASVAVVDRMRAVWWLAGVQLVLGIGFEVSAWRLTPVWYHVVFLMLLVPAILYGGRLRAGAGPRAYHAGA
jgi:hypothetical protein